MSAMKDMFMDLQDQVYEKLENLGVPRKIVYKFEKMFPNDDFGDVTEKIAGYAMTIYILSETTGYEKDRLWNIWMEMMQDFVNGNTIYEELDEVWESFKEITQERDW